MADEPKEGVVVEAAGSTSNAVRAHNLAPDIAAGRPIPERDKFAAAALAKARATIDSILKLGQR